MTNDFLARTAERALGQATMVTPLLASTYGPGSGFGPESELRIVAPSLAPSDPRAVARRRRPAPVPDAPHPQLSPQKRSVTGAEAIDTRAADAAPAPEPELRSSPPPSAEAESSGDEPQSTLPPLAREQFGARPITPVREPLADPVLAPGETLLPMTEPTLEAVETVQGQPPLPSFERHAQQRAARRPADRAEAAPRPSTAPERRQELTLDVAPAVGPTLAKVVAAKTTPMRVEPPASLSRLKTATDPEQAARRRSAARADDSPPVRVTIGRVEIRGDSPPPPAPSPPSRPALPLDEYLRTRGGVA